MCHEDLGIELHLKTEVPEEAEEVKAEAVDSEPREAIPITVEKE